MTKITATLYEDQYQFLIMSQSVHLDGEFIQIKFVETNKTRTLRSKIFSFLENRAVYEIMWKNIVEHGRPQMTMWRMLIAC